MLSPTHNLLKLHPQSYEAPLVTKINQNAVVLSELELAKMEDAQIESHRPSPKVKSTLRRRKRPLTHLRTAHLDETLSPVTTPTDEEVIQRIKHVAGLVMHMLNKIPHIVHLKFYSLGFCLLRPQVPPKQNTFLSTH